MDVAGLPAGALASVAGPPAILIGKRGMQRPCSSADRIHQAESVSDSAADPAARIEQLIPSPDRRRLTHEILVVSGIDVVSLQKRAAAEKK